MREPRTRRQTVPLTLVGLFIALVIPLLRLPQLLPGGTGTRGPLVREIFYWLLTVVLLLYVLVIERRPLSSVGFRRPTWRTFVWGICSGIVIVVCIGIIYAVVFPLFHLTMNRAVYSQIRQSSLLFRFVLVLRAAVFEELAYRGYSIERLSELTRHPTLAGGIAWIFFTFAHLSGWGWAQLIVAGFAGLLLTALYLWRHDLICNMLAHFITDGAGFLLG